jgi:hypothetical protein
MSHRRIVAATDLLLRSDLDARLHFDKQLAGSVTARTTGASLRPHHDRKRQM